MTKIEVLDPMSMFNTVGQELEEIVEAHSKDKKYLLDNLGWGNFSSVKKISKKDLKVIVQFLEADDSIESFFTNIQNKYKEREKSALLSYNTSKKYFNKFKHILPLLRNEFNDGIDILEDITNFFGVDTEEEIMQESEDCILFRKQNTVPVDTVNLKAWLRRGELDFNKMDLPAYNEERLMAWIESRVWSSNVDNVKYFKNLPHVLSEFGVALILVPFLPKTVYGAIRWIEDRPLIQLSDRNSDLASCWFTLFHELGHAILHKNDTIFEGEINESVSKVNEKERDANKFANTFLFNGDNMRKAVFEIKRSGRDTNYVELSHQFEVHPIFAAYWLRKAQYRAASQLRIPVRFS